MTHKTDDELLAEANALDEAYAGAEAFDEAANAVERDIRALVKAARAALLDMAPPPGCQPWQSALDLEAALDQFEPWLDAHETPEGRP